MRRSRTLAASSARNDDVASARPRLSTSPHDALVDQVEELRHAREDGDAAARQRAHQLRASSASRGRRRARRPRTAAAGWPSAPASGTAAARPARCRSRVTFDDRERRVPLGDQVGVGQHHALGIGGRARGVEDHGGRAAASSATAGLGGRMARRSLTASGRVHVEPRRRPVSSASASSPLAASRSPANSTRAPESLQDRGDLRRPNSWCRTARRRRRGEDGEVGGTPVGVVVGEDRAAVAGLNAGRRSRAARSSTAREDRDRCNDRARPCAGPPPPCDRRTPDGLLEMLNRFDTLGSHTTTAEPWPGSGAGRTTGARRTLEVGSMGSIS